MEPGGVLFGVRAASGGQKVGSQKGALAGYEKYVGLWRVDDVVAIAQAASHERDVTVAVPCACDDLSRGTIGIKNAVSLMGYAHLLAVLQGARDNRLRFLNNAAVARLAAFSGKPVDADWRMGQAIGFVFANDRHSFFVKSSYLLRGEGGLVERLKKVAGHFIGVHRSE